MNFAGPGQDWRAMVADGRGWMGAQPWTAGRGALWGGLRCPPSPWAKTPSPWTKGLSPWGKAPSPLWGPTPQAPYWAPTPGGGWAKQYPPGQAGIPYAWHPDYGIVQ